MGTSVAMCIASDASLRDGEAQLWWANSEAVTGSTEQYCCLLSDDERDRVARFKSSAAARRFAIGRACLRTLVSRHLGVEPLALRIGCGDFGKPYVLQQPSKPALQFSVSHCGNTSFYAVTRSGEIGIDIESVALADECHNIEPIFCSQQERELLLGLASSELPRAWLQLWTHKEALLKAVGTGLYEAPTEHSIFQNPAELFEECTTECMRKVWRVRALKFGDEFIGSLVTEPLVDRIKYCGQVAPS